MPLLSIGPGFLTDRTVNFLSPDGHGCPTALHPGSEDSARKPGTRFPSSYQHHGRQDGDQDGLFTLSGTHLSTVGRR